MNDAVTVRAEGGVMEECEVSAEVLLSDTMDQYRTFQMCERLLHHPAKLANQLLFQIPPDRQAMLIERCASICVLPTEIVYLLNSFVLLCLNYIYPHFLLGIMLLMICLFERSWEKNSPKEQKKTLMMLAQRQALR